MRGAAGTLMRPVVTYPASTASGVPVPFISVSTNLQSFGLSHTPQRSQDEVSVFEEAIRTRVNAVLTFQNCNVDAIPSALAKNTAAGKSIYLTFAPTDLAGVLAGTYDTNIKLWARTMAGVGFIRFAHEMNASWYIWGSGYGAANYVTLWNYVRTLWQAEETRIGAAHIPWFWCPNLSGGANAFGPYYPGDSACEYVGLDGYSTKTAGLQSFQTLFDADLTTLEALSTRPILIGETSVEGSHPNKASWIAAMWAYLHASRPRVKGVNYWHHDNENPFVGYRIDNNPAAAEAYRAGLATWAPSVT